ncbi:sigma factor-like helix-turn-helix DNA-binding protein [Bacillus sp. 1P06AnD]|uniref:sigma factor-like helix-turn-helix DNA-binding protein n=1 Tax=Bacillus sp. 1P06AnD TaxID=3132208 RepID=UPI00399F9BC8
MNGSECNRKEEEDYGRFMEHYNALRKYCLFLCRNLSDGEDLLQDTMLKAMQRYGEAEELHQALFRKIAYHAWVDNKRRQDIELMERVEDVFIVDPLSSETAKEVLERMLHLLTAKQAVVFILKEVFQYRSKEIAFMLQTNETAVKALLHRSKKRLLSFEEDEEAQEQDLDEEKEEMMQWLWSSITRNEPQLLIKRLHHLLSLHPIHSVHGRTESSTHSKHSLYLAA